MKGISRLGIQILLGLSGLLFLGCSSSEEVVPQNPRVENLDLGIAIATLPAGFSVKENQGSQLLLERPQEENVTLWIELLSEDQGVNLYDSLNQMEAEFEAMEAGQYLGNVELGGPLGPAFSARGRFELDGQAFEESRVISLGPQKDRQLRLRYRYPVGSSENSKNRMQEELWVVFGEIEALTPN